MKKYYLKKNNNILNKKRNGFRRTNPQNPPESFSDKQALLKCDQCEAKLESQGLLTAHSNSHIKAHLISCEKCETKFTNKDELENHMSKQHLEEKIFLDWNCNDCPFQGDTAMTLLNHLKITSHQPSSLVDKRNLFEDYRQCYTCKEEFDSYQNLMNHRKIVHPSNKKCRNFPTKCTFNNDCWYVHDEQMETESLAVTDIKTALKFQCNLCESNFNQRDEFMKHRKIKHQVRVDCCNKFTKGECSRTENTCWFRHSTQTTYPEKVSSPLKQVFQEAQAAMVPPDQISKVFQMMSLLSSQVTNLEKMFRETLN